MAVAALALMLSCLALAVPPASADYSTCGSHTHTDKTRISGGYHVKVRIHYLNCGYRSTRLRPNVSNRIDPPCQTIYAGGTGYWSFEYSYYDGFTGGLPAYQGLYNC